MVFKKGLLLIGRSLDLMRVVGGERRFGLQLLKFGRGVYCNSLFGLHFACIQFESSAFWKCLNLCKFWLNVALFF